MKHWGIKGFNWGWWIAALLIVWGATVKSCREIRKDRDRLADNQRRLMSEVEFYTTRDSLSAAGIERLTLTNREFRNYAGELEQTVESLRLKIKRLQSVSRSSTVVRYTVTAEVRDSIIPVRRDTIRCFQYHDAYLSLAGCIEGKVFSGEVESRDTLVQVVHRIPRRFWFIRWGTKAIRQEVVSRNPYARIVYTEYIELKK